MKHPQRWRTSTAKACLGAAVGLWATLSTAQTLNCRVDACTYRQPDGSCDLERAVRSNDRCAAWNGAVAQGRLPDGARPPKPVQGAALSYRVRAINACIDRQTTAGVPKGDAVEACGEDAKFDTTRTAVRAAGTASAAKAAAP